MTPGAGAHKMEVARERRGRVDRVLLRSRRWTGRSPVSGPGTAREREPAPRGGGRTAHTPARATPRGAGSRSRAVPGPETGERPVQRLDLRRTRSTRHLLSRATSIL